MVEQNKTHEAETEPQRQEKRHPVRNFLSLFLFIATLVVGYLTLPAVDSSAVTDFARVALVLIGGLLPIIIYDSFTRERLPALRTEYKQNLRRLGYPASMGQYQAKFDEIYGHRPQAGRPWFVSSPTIIATVLALIGWLLVFFPQSAAVEGAQGSAPAPNPTPMVYGFLGAYVFSLGSLIRQYVVNDLQPRYYASLTHRYLSVFILSWLVTLLVPAVNGGEQPTSGTYQLAAFAIGLFPTTGLRIAQRAGTAILGQVFDSFAESYPLSKIDGVNAYHEDRLLLEGVENLQSLCSVQIVDLMLKTRYPVEQIVDWIDQALLHLHARGRILDFQESGLRTATDFLDAYAPPGLSQDELGRRRRDLAALLDAQRARRLGDGEASQEPQPAEGQPAESAATPTLTQLDIIAAALASDPNLFHVRYWRDHPYEALPEDVERKRTVGDLQLMQGFPKKAITTYTDLLRDFPAYRTALLYRGLACYALGDYVHAIEDYDRLIDPDKPKAEHTRQAYLERGRALRELGEYQAAVENYQQAIEIYKPFPEARLDLARVQMARLGQYDRAIENLQHIESQEFKAEALANLGLARYENWKLQGRLAADKTLVLNQAREDLDRAIRLKPDLVEAYLNLALVLEELAREAEALEALTEALRRLQITPEPQTAYRAYLQRGSLYLKRGEYAAAADDFVEANRLMPLEAAALYNLGLARQRLGQLDLAAYALRDATRVYPQHAPAHQARGDVALARGRLEEAEEAYSRALMLTRQAGDTSGQALARLSLGRLYRRIPGRQSDARREFQQATELAGEAGSDLLYTQATFESGLLNLESGALEQAVDQLITCAELFDVLGEVRASVRAGLELGRAYLAQRNPDAAQAALQEARQKLDRVFDPQNPTDAALQAEIEAELARCEAG